MIGLGSKEVLLLSNTACCDANTGGKVPSARLDILVPTSLKRARKPKPVHDASKELKERLTAGLLNES